MQVNYKSTDFCFFRNGEERGSAAPQVGTFIADAKQVLSRTRSLICSHPLVFIMHKVINSIREQELKTV